MRTNNKFSSIIIGETTLAIQCAEVLLDRGHRISAMVSACPEIERWANEHGARVVQPDGKGWSALERLQFDYLFSIVNSVILPKNLLELPKCGAINFHDSLLPRYAGVHATSWAIMQGETGHGVTWHLMSERVDAGDILKQRSVPITAEDTAFSLNTKCYEAAIASFSELIDELAEGRVERRSQDLGRRTLFSQFKRPPLAGLVCWNESGAQISALVRALEFGPYSNPLGRAKLRIGNQSFVCRKAGLLDNATRSLPGTIIDIDDAQIVVAARDGSVAVRGIFSLEGRSISVGELAARTGLQRGTRLDELDTPAAQHLTALDHELARHESFWARRLRIRPISIPYGAGVKSAGLGPRFEQFQCSLPSEIWQSKMALAFSKRGAFLLAAFALYLRRLTRDDSFSIGFSSWALERAITGFDDLFAPVVPFAVVSLDCGTDIGSAFIRASAELEQVNRRKTFGRDLLSRDPELSLNRADTDPFHYPIMVQWLDAVEQPGHVEPGQLRLLISPDGDQCRILYDANRLGSAVVQRFAGHFMTFLEGVASQPNARLAEVPLLNPDERQQLIDGSQGAANPVPNRCIHELWSEQASRAPNRVALLSDDGQLTFEQLERRSSQLAGHLARRGVGAGSRVGIAVQRSLDMVVGLLAILKAGGAYVPLDPAYPRERLEFMMQDSRISLLLTQHHRLPNLPSHGAAVLCLDGDWQAIEGDSGGQLSSAGPEDPAYVIYTSGSTGRPKGVVIPHRALVNHSLAMRRLYRLDDRDRMLQFASLSFDVAAEELFPPLLGGAAVVLGSSDGLTVPSDFVGYIDRQQVTVLNLPVSYWQALLSSMSEEQLTLPSSIRLVIVGNERVPSQAFVNWRRLAGDGVEWINAYGPTETTITATIFPAQPGWEPLTLSVPIGRPIDNVEVYVLDEHLNLAPPGMVGELHIGGAGLASVYLNQPELTAAKFIPHPFSHHPGARLYRTGDLVRYLDGGSLEFLGRVDDQVKLRGFRIELGEIEAVLSAHPAVGAVSVIVRDGGPAETQLVAYWICRRGMMATAKELRAFARQRLPDYMVPGPFVMLEAFPLTPNGKVDHRALPKPEPERGGSDPACESPRNSTEATLSLIWREILRLKQISMNDDFFELGGHSLLATQIISRVNRAFGMELSLRALFEAGTIRRLAELIDTMQWAAQGASAPDHLDQEDREVGTV